MDNYHCVLEDLVYANDVCLLSSHHREVQETTTGLIRDKQSEDPP